MKTTLYRRLALALILGPLLLLAACGGGVKVKTPAGNGNPSVSVPNGVTAGGGVSSRGTMSAKIDGKSWTAKTVTTATYANGIISVGGADSSNPLQVLSFAIAASGPGTYHIGDVTQTSATALLDINSAIWQAVVFNGSGTITVTSLTTTGAAGTFSFSMNPVANTSASGTKTITDGSFNVTFSSPAVINAPPPSAPGGAAAIRAQVNGQAWAGTGTQASSYKNQFLSIIGFDSQMGSTITLGLGGVTGPGTFSLAYGSSGGSSAIYATGAGKAWDSALPGGTGSVVITAISATHVVGDFSFDGTTATSSSDVVHVTNGHFDITFQ